MTSCPLSPEYDSPSHYLAGENHHYNQVMCNSNSSGQPLTSFGLDVGEEEPGAEELSTSRLRDVVNIHLVTQSELLRRLCLCLSGDLRSGRSLNLSEDLEVMRAICDQVEETLGRNCDQLQLCLRYTRALGCSELPENVTRGREVTRQGDI